MNSANSVQSICYPGAIPYLIVRDAAAALEFYARAFNAREIEAHRMTMPDGRIMHAEFKIDAAPFYITGESPDLGWSGPESLGGSTVLLHLYVENVDERFEQATRAGCKVNAPLETKFYGDRGGTLVDPFGQMWSLASHVEDVSPEELERRFRAMIKS